MATFKFSGVSVRGYRLGGQDTLEEDLSFRWTSAEVTTEGVGPTTMQAPETVAETAPRCAALTTDREPGAAPDVNIYMKIPNVPGSSQSKAHRTRAM